MRKRTQKKYPNEVRVSVYACEDILAAVDRATVDQIENVRENKRIEDKSAEYLVVLDLHSFIVWICLEAENTVASEMEDEDNRRLI